MFDHYDSQDAAMHWRSKYLTRNVKIFHSKNIWPVKIKIAVVRLVKSLVIFILPGRYL
jgi:hypothetical protein